MKKLSMMAIGIAVMVCISGCSNGNAKEIDELKDRIEELEEENKELKAELKDTKKISIDEELEASEGIENFIVETSGVCGANLTWEYGNGILKVKGTGEMTDYDADNVPWASVKEKIGHVYIEEGVTTIGYGTFVDMPVLSKIIIPSSVQRIDYRAVIESVGYPASVVTEEDRTNVLTETIHRFLVDELSPVQEVVWGGDKYTSMDEFVEQIDISGYLAPTVAPAAAMEAPAEP